MNDFLDDREREEKARKEREREEKAREEAEKKKKEDDFKPGSDMHTWATTKFF